MSDNGTSSYRHATTQACMRDATQFRGPLLYTEGGERIGDEGHRVGKQGRKDWRAVRVFFLNNQQMRLLMLSV